MELEKWLEVHDIKKMVIDDLNFYLKEYKNDHKEEYEEVFKDMDLEEVSYEYHSVAYVINEWYILNGKHKYISARVRLSHQGVTFGEYESIYDLDGNAEDDYVRFE